MNETWAAVPGWDGLYEVSDAGRVRSLDRTVCIRNPHGVLAPRTYRGRVLKAAIGPSGYPLVSFTAPGRKREYHFVHALVARAFIGPRPDGLDVCHGNGVRSDNRLENLRYDTRQANAMDRHAHGTIVRRFGEACHVAKLTDDAVRFIRANRTAMSMRALARKFGVAHRTIGAVIRGESWPHIQ
jgi:hypothetical protein